MSNEIKTYAFTPVLGQENDLQRETELKNEELTSLGHFFQVDFCSPQIVIITSDAPKNLLHLSWAKFEWGEVEEVRIDSISKTSKYLNSKGKKWKHVSINAHRRGELIAQNLNSFKDSKIIFKSEDQCQESYSFGLLNNEQIILSKGPSLFPGGDVSFFEDRINPPSRAYLKLWEVFTRFQKMPPVSSSCIDVGSCPGGWTWVLANLGHKVISVDKAMIDDKLIANPLVTFKQESAFALIPENFDDNLTWFFSDIICYPSKLLELVNKWIAAKPHLNFICTIKFQGETDFDALKKFREIPGSRTVHLFHNKHELTWIKTKVL